MTVDGATPRMSPLGDAVEMPVRGLLARDSVLRRLDWVLILAVVALLGFGTMLVYSATRGESGTSQAAKHLVNAALGVVLCAGATLVGYQTLRAYAPVVYLLSCLGLVAVLAIGVEIFGQKSWIRVGAGFDMQPSEFAKVALVIILAMLLGERRDGEEEPPTGQILGALLLAGLPIGLIMLQPDLGTALVFVVTILAVLAVAPVRLRWIGGLLVAGAGVVVLAFQVGAVRPHQITRLLTFANPETGAQDVAWNAIQAQIAVGSGGLTGQGWLQGKQTELNYVPVQESDFIFTVAGEEFGFVGGVAIIVLLGIILWRGFHIARAASDRFGMLVATGVVAWFGFQAFENIGMTLGIMPITGIPLPFVSYGGSSMLANLIAIGLLLNVHLSSTARASEGWGEVPRSRRPSQVLSEV